jgi:hypothetical protein
LTKFLVPERNIFFSYRNSVLVPVPDGRRRHSYQAGAAGVGALARDMERLRVGGAEGGAQPAAGAKPGISPRPSKKRRASTRRSSRSGSGSKGRHGTQPVDTQDNDTQYTVRCEHIVRQTVSFYCYILCHSADNFYAKCRYAECHYAV